MSSNPCENQELSWAVQPAINKIDTHHHIVPDFYSKGMFLEFFPYNQANISQLSVMLEVRTRDRRAVS